jgi:cytochrome c-type biogenesis protein CcmH
MSPPGAFLPLCGNKAPGRWTAALAIAALALLLVAPALSLAAAAPRTTVADLEDEVMCPICGTLLELSEAPQAHRERAYIAGLIAAGKTKAQIKVALVAQYGREVLALPRGSGFDLSAYLAPAIAFAGAVVALAFAVGRWRRAGRRPGSRPPAPAGPEGEDAERLEADLSRYDL